ncbi:MAG: hypothetical protein EZS28_010146 [Streblomastix strix]|uniref:Uncharacterized protein n=1 Tax=Streblomastix strix TaxID=222440 RepID=A0A5J4WHN2_9EUKA|nr:MAG: hypothetical protein EZS28_010146 [Streblomastix strix]
MSDTISQSPSSYSPMNHIQYSPSFFEQENILEETSKFDTGGWELIFRERREQIDYNAQPQKMMLKGNKIAIEAKQ